MPLSVFIVTGLWVLLVGALFLRLSPRRAVIISFIAGWLFLPVVNYPISHLPDFTKLNVTCLGVLLGVVLFDSKSVRAFRPRWVDLPVGIWCMAPFAASITNGLGVYDALSETFAQTTTWGIPYLLGRIYLTDLGALRELATGIFIGGLVYVPLCWIEIIAGPHLHFWLYGTYPSAIEQEVRYGGWRPVVFMQHGLMVGFWMTAATLCGFWLWRGFSENAFLKRASALGVVALLTTTISAKSTGAWILLGLGAWLLLMTTWRRTALPVIALVALILLYVALRGTGLWSGGEVVAAIAASQDRALSLSYRLTNENLLAERARERWLFGWGGWGRNLVHDAGGNHVTVPDSLWIVAFGSNGVVGLMGILGALLLPGVLFLRRQPGATWAAPAVAAAAVLAVVVLLYAVDDLVNAMVNPIYMLAAGGLVGWAVSAPR